MKTINEFVLEKLQLNNQSKLKDNKFWMLISIKYNSSIINDFSHIYLKRIIFMYSNEKDENHELYLITIKEFKDFFSSLSFLKRHFTDFTLYEVPEELPISKTSTKDEIDKYVENDLNDLLQASNKWDYDNLKKQDITYFINLNNYNINEKLVLNSQSKLNKKLNKWVLCRYTLFDDEALKFIKQYKDRNIRIWSRQLSVYVNLYLITVDEAINFWGLDNIQTSPNKVYTNTCCFLYKLPEPIQNNATDEDIKKYIKDHNEINNDAWEPIDLEKYFIDYENN